MATARNLPDRYKHEGSPDAALWDILISPGGTVPLADQFLKVGSFDTIEFHNTAGFPVNIIFTNEFVNIMHLQNGLTSGPQGNSNGLHLTLNYSIANANSGQITGGPYAIQFGIGALPISIVSLNTNPDPVAVPSLGKIAITADVKYNIAWTFANGQPANVWTPAVNPLPAGTTTLTAGPGATSQSLSYTITTTVETHGGGTVNVGS